MPSPRFLVGPDPNDPPMLRRYLAGAFDIALCAPFGCFGCVAISPVLFLPVLSVYCIAQEVAFGRTLGQRIFGLRVVGWTGERPTVAQALVRALARAAEWTFIPMFTGLKYPYSTRSGQTIGDRLSRTFVVVDGTERPRAMPTAAVGWA